MFGIYGKYKNIQHYLISVKEVVKNCYPAKNLVVIGVTGTDGKTTTCHLIYEILKTSGKKIALVSTVAAYVKDKVIDTGFHVTTPDAKFLQPLIRKFADQGVKYLVLEVTSHGLDQHRVLGCNFYAGVLTNVTHEHLDYHRTFNNYRNTKAKLFKGVRVAVLNKDDPSYPFFKSKLKKQTKVVSYSMKKKADIEALKTEFKGSRTRIIIAEGEKVKTINTSLVGDYNVSNILAAVGVARLLGVKWQFIKKAVEHFQSVIGRMEEVRNKRGIRIIVDFAHTPNALKNVLTFLKPQTKGKLIVVFGCAGERDIAKRPMMGKIATKIADFSVFTAEDPRSENVDNITEQVIGGIDFSRTKEISPSLYNDIYNKSKNHYFFRIPDRGKAITFVINKLAKRGDIVVVSGKGHEKSMCYNGVEYPWSDQEAIKRALNLRMPRSFWGAFK